MKDFCGYAYITLNIGSHFYYHCEILAAILAPSRQVLFLMTGKNSQKTSKKDPEEEDV